jgi:hypothetical protein
MPQPTRTRRDAPSPATVAWAAKQSDRRPGVLSGLHRLGGHPAWGRSPFDAARECRGARVPRRPEWWVSGGAGLILRGDHLLGEDLASLVEDGLPCGLWGPHRDADAPGILTVPLLDAASHLP